MSGRLPVSFLLLHFWPFLKCPHRQKGKTGKKLHYLTVFWQFWEEAQRVEIEMKALRVFLDHLQVLFLSSMLPRSWLLHCFLHCISEGGNCSSMLISLPHLKNTRRKCKCTWWRLLLKMYYKIYVSPPRTPLRKGFSSSLLGGGQTMGRGQLGL